MSNDGIPVAVCTETMRVLGVDVEVHVLDDGRRIIGTDDFERLLAILGVPADEEGEP
jgi:hypothetical protein